MVIIKVRIVISGADCVTVCASVCGQGLFPSRLAILWRCSSAGFDDNIGALYFFNVVYRSTVGEHCKQGAAVSNTFTNSWVAALGRCCTQPLSCVKLAARVRQRAGTPLKRLQQCSGSHAVWGFYHSGKARQGRQQQVRDRQRSEVLDADKGKGHNTADSASKIIITPEAEKQGLPAAISKRLAAAAR